MTTAITFSAPVIRKSGTSLRVTTTLSTPESSFELYYNLRGVEELSVNATAIVAAILLPAMVRNWPITSEFPISQQVSSAIPVIQDIFHVWDRKYSRVPVQSPTTTGSANKQEQSVASFFSGGVDSFYTYLKHRDEINTFIFVIGFDIPIANSALSEKVLPSMRRAAQKFGVSLVEVETNLRDFSDPFMPWEMYHGAALASIALLLSPLFHKCYIPASHTYTGLFPWGSHPLLDPLWSTEDCKVIHDGCEAARIEKVFSIADNDVALQTLRVCWQNPGSSYNCGRCEKCLRTMISLYAAGALSRCTTFDTPLSIQRVASIRAGDRPNKLTFLRENLAEVERRGDNPRLASALRKAMRSPGIVRVLTRRLIQTLLRHDITARPIKRAAKILKNNKYTGSYIASLIEL